MTVTITTECAHCGEPVHLEIDSELDYRVTGKAAKPVVFVPLVDFAKIKAPNIIDDF